MQTVTHIAGPVMNIDGRAIQRCAVCGEKLIDSRGMMGPVQKCAACLGTGRSLRREFEATGMLTCQQCGGEGKHAPIVATWKEGGLVQFTVGTNPRRESALPEPENKKLPADSCISLVE